MSPTHDRVDPLDAIKWESLPTEIFPPGEFRAAQCFLERFRSAEPRSERL
jgi:hypothetical protein